MFMSKFNIAQSEFNWPSTLLQQTNRIITLRLICFTKCDVLMKQTESLNILFREEIFIFPK